MAAGRPRGFTLLELTIVLVLTGLVMGYAGLTFSGYFQRTSAQRAAQVFARDLKLARSAALRSRQAVVVRFYESSRWYQIQTKTSGNELVRRRFGANADVGLSAIDLRIKGDTMTISSRGVANLADVQDGSSLAEARFSAGATTYSVFFNSLGASKVQKK